MSARYDTRAERLAKRLGLVPVDVVECVSRIAAGVAQGRAAGDGVQARIIASAAVQILECVADELERETEMRKP